MILSKVTTLNKTKPLEKMLQPESTNSKANKQCRGLRNFIETKLSINREREREMFKSMIGYAFTIEEI